MSDSNPRPTVSLVLGSGGARGLAHIGVIDALAAAGMEIRAISGCSMGALIGGIYAMGELETYRKWVCALERIDVIRLLDFSFRSAGLIKGNRIIDVMKLEIGETRIEDLPIRYTAVATDLDTQKEVWIEEGPLFDAIRASMAIPTVFTPATWQDRTLVDGALVNPVPIAPTMRYANDLTIAVDVCGRPDVLLPPIEEPPEEPAAEPSDSYHQAIRRFVDDVTTRLAKKMSPEERESGLNLFEVVSRSFDIMQNTVARLKTAAHGADLMIEIPRDICLTYEFYKAEEIIHIGRQRAEEALAHLRR